VIALQPASRLLPARMRSQTCRSETQLWWVIHIGRHFAPR